MKRILIISGSFYPENSPRSFRTTELAKELARQGHDVTLYFPLKGYDYSDYATENNLTIKNLGEIKFSNIIHKGNRMESLIRRALIRILLLLFEYPGIEFFFKVAKLLKHESGYDLVISVAVPFPIHWGVAKARKRRNRIGKTWVADCGDPYMGCKTDSFKKFFYFKYVEKWFCRKADYISVPNEDHFGQYYPEFAPKMRAIPQGFRFEDSNVYSGQIAHPVPTFAFAGVLLKEKRDPTNLLKYLVSVDTDFKFILYTESHQLLEPFKKKLGQKLEIRSYIRREELIYVLSQMDFLLNIEFHLSVGSNSPSKLIDYAITGRPVLSLNMEEMDTQLLDEFFDGEYSGKMEINDIDRFRIENVASRFLHLIQEKHEG